MPLSPPWNWMMHELPPDTETCWLIRTGNPEKPFQGTWDLAAAAFHVAIGAESLDIPAAVVLKWRLLAP